MALTGLTTAPLGRTEHKPLGFAIMSLGPGMHEVGTSTERIGIPTSEEGLVGRTRDLDGIAAALADSARMITLVGPGGIGKTRLAATTALRLRKAGGMPVYWVHLARLPRGATAAAVEEEMVAAVLDGDFSSRTGFQALVDAIGGVDTEGRPLASVLVLDNCEHVLDGVGAVVAELLAALPGLIVLATSRSAIGWADEQIVMIPPLAREQAVALFGQRAELAGRPVADAESDLVEPICRHLNYFPLHIRLAAARLRYQSLPMILRDLEGDDAGRRLRWSPGFRVGADERHRDINAVIGWSYELCGPKERLLFERMSVFAAGYDVNPEDVDSDRGVVVLDIGADIEAIAAVCADASAGGLTNREIEGLLEQLVDRSLVALHVGVDTVRYSLLESFRVFALERLTERSAAEHRMLATRHLHYYRDRVAELCTGWISAEEQELLARARADWDNIATAIAASATQRDQAAIGARMAVDLIASRLPFLRGSLREFRRLAQGSLAAVLRHGQCPPGLEVSTHAWIGWLSACQGLPEEAEQLLEQCVAACMASVLPAGWRDDPAFDLGLPAEVDYLWGSILLLVYGDPRATALLQRSRTKLTAVGVHGGAAMAGLFEALSAGFFGTAEEALRVTGAHLDATVASGAEWAISHAQFARAIALSAHGDPSEALALCNAGLARQIPMRDQWCCVWGVHIRGWSLAQLILGSGASDEQIIRWASDIARVSGSIEPVRRQIGLDVLNLKPFAERTHHAIETARNVLGSKVFDAMAREGEQMPNVVVLAATLLSAPLPPAPQATVASRGSAWTELTAAEQEVAVLAAGGLTNAAIADRRGTSTRTADAQLASILSKLMINSRKDILPSLPAAERERVTAEDRRRSGRRR